MRLGVLDVGSNTVHLLVVDAYPGARPLPAFSHKTELRLADHLDNGSSLSRPGERSLRDVVVEALGIAEDKGVEDLIAFATSAVREAKNGEEVLARIRDQTAAQITVMTGPEEARLTFLAARRWFGWSSGRLLVIDIGGPLSHGAIAARELGIPCVINTRDGSRRLRTGDTVVVDGSTGAVELVGAAELSESEDVALA